MTATPTPLPSKPISAWTVLAPTVIAERPSRRLDRAVEVDALDVAAPGQLTQQPLGHPGGAAAHPRQAAFRAAAVRADGLVGVAVVVELDDDRQVVVVGVDVLAAARRTWLRRPARAGRRWAEASSANPPTARPESRAWRRKRRGPGKVLVRPTPRDYAGGSHARRQRKAAARTVVAITRLVRSGELLSNSSDCRRRAAHRIHRRRWQHPPGSSGPSWNSRARIRPAPRR